MKLKEEFTKNIAYSLYFKDNITCLWKIKSICSTF